MTDRTPPTEQQLDEIDTRVTAATVCPEVAASGRKDGQHTWTGSMTHLRCELCSYTRPRGERAEETATLLAEVRRLRAELAMASGERDCLAMAVLFARQWTPEAPMSLRDGLDEIIATMPGAGGSSVTAADTLPAWLAKRFDPRGAEWDGMSADDRTYWEHQARAVRRAVARDGFKTEAAPAAAGAGVEPGTRQ